eukprot:2746374-Pyramimonas_sp.AAC.1
MQLYEQSLSFSAIGATAHRVNSRETLGQRCRRCGRWAQVAIRCRRVQRESLAHLLLRYYPT